MNFMINHPWEIFTRACGRLLRFLVCGGVMREGRIDVRIYWKALSVKGFDGSLSAIIL